MARLVKLELIFLHRQHRSGILKKMKKLGYLRHLLLRSQKLGHHSGKNKLIHFSKQFQKRNQKLCTTKLPLRALQPIYKWYLFSSMMSSCISCIQSISFIILLLDFNGI